MEISSGARSNNPLRLVFVTRRFWPLVGSAENALADLAAAMVARGCRVTVVTAAWESAWPTDITLRGVPVVRLPRVPEGRWNTGRYGRLLGGWLRENGPRCDLVYVLGLKHDAATALRVLHGRIPVVLRPQGTGRDGDCLWQIEEARGRQIKRRCMKADALVASDRAVEHELQAAGFPRRRIHYIANGVPTRPNPTPLVKAKARRALALAGSAFELPAETPLAVYTGRLDRGKGLRCLIAAWRTVVARWPNARLWLAGEGPRRAALIRQIGAMNLAGRVVPVGTIDDVQELLAATDLFVRPSTGGNLSLGLLEAMAAGLPIAAADTETHRTALTHETHGLLFPPDSADALADAIIRLIDRPDSARRWAVAAKKRADDDFSLAKMVDRHVTLFESLTRESQ